jgi:hypothetical protein
VDGTRRRWEMLKTGATIKMMLMYPTILCGLEKALNDALRQMLHATF